jgi:hypothetical protein
LQYANSKQLNLKEAPMAALNHRRQEAYCQARARGLSQEDAATSPECLYSKKYGSKLDRNPEVQKRIVEITAAPQWSVSRDIAPVIDQLVLAVQASAALGTGAGLKAAGDLWAKVADLKQKLPRSPDSVPTRRRPMTAEEWKEKFQPKC